MTRDFVMLSRAAALAVAEQLPLESADSVEAYRVGAMMRGRVFAPGPLAMLRETSSGWVLTVDEESVPEVVLQALSAQAVLSEPARPAVNDGEI